MARAKQTSRADARRRYRQTAAAVEEADGDDASTGSASAAAASARPGARGAPAGSAGRPGLTSAFRGAYQSPHYRDDLRALPELLRGKWFLIATALSALGLVAYAVYPTSVTALVVTLVSAPPGGPTLPVFLVGFTAPRASYLLGPAVGILNLIVYAVLVTVVPTAFASGTSPAPVATDVLFQGALYGLPTAVLFSSGAAWYHRFLNLSNPRFGAPRGQQRGGRSKSAQKAAARR